VVWALNGPVWFSVVPTLVPRDEIHRAVALNSVQFNLARLCGPVIAGVVIAQAGVKLAFAVNAATFLLVIVALISLPPLAAPSVRVRRGIRHDLMAGLRFVVNHRGTRRLAIMAAVFAFLAAPIQGLLPVFAKDVVRGGPEAYGLMLGAIGLGAVTGALLVGHLPARFPRHILIPAAMFLFSACALAYSFSTWLQLSLVLLTLGGLFMLVALNSTNTANQLLASDENRGRVVSVMILSIQGALPFGHLFAGVLSQYYSPQTVVRAMVGALFVLTAYFLVRREPAIDAGFSPPLAASEGGPVLEALAAPAQQPATAASLAAEGEELAYGAGEVESSRRPGVRSPSAT
jgi:predicted MFS family arabinose efflux permease